MQRLTALSLGAAYREWLLEEARREADSGCARLRRVLDEQPAFLLEQIAGWPADQVAALLRAHVKRGWRRDLPPVKLTAEEERVYPTFEWPVVSPDAVSRTKVVWELRQRSLRGDFKINAKELRGLVKARLDRDLGKGTVVSGVLRYPTSVGGLAVFTDVDYPTKGTAQLRYGHSIAAGSPDERVGIFDRRVLLKDASLFDLMGGPQAQWSCLSNEDIPAAVETLADLCVGFLDELPKIVRAAGG
jgi:hypothetical protein